MAINGKSYRVDDDIYKEYKNIVKEAGMTVQGSLVLYMKRVIQQNKKEVI